MECGQGIMIRDFYGATRARFIAQCQDRFLMISHDYHNPRNGYLLADWRQVLRELIAMAVPAALIEKTCTVEGAGADGLYMNFPLTYPLSAAQFADLFGVAAYDVRTELSDLAVLHD